MTDNTKRDEVVAQLTGAGLKFKQAPPLFNYIIIESRHGEIVLREMQKRTIVRGPNGRQVVFVFAGYTVRYDWAGQGGMGTKRYPLRKDGTIDIERLKGDIDSFEKREASRAAAMAEVNANAKTLEAQFEQVREMAHKLSGASGSGVFIEVENDGRAEGRIRFKVSGHITPERALFIIAAVAASSKGE